MYFFLLKKTNRKSYFWKRKVKSIISVFFWVVSSGRSCPLGGGVCCGFGKDCILETSENQFLWWCWWILHLKHFNFKFRTSMFFYDFHIIWFFLIHICLVSQFCRIDMPKLFKSFISQLSRLEPSIGFILKFISQVHVYFLYLVLFRHEVSISCLIFWKSNILKHWMPTSLEILHLNILLKIRLSIFPGY